MGTSTLLFNAAEGRIQITCETLPLPLSIVPGEKTPMGQLRPAWFSRGSATYCVVDGYFGRVAGGVD